jgi:predicted MFS family arabinose efflux permease
MKNFVLLNRNSNTAILLAGIIALIIGIGVSRFVFTSLLPTMLEDHLTIHFAGILASLNYVGYLSGSIFAIFIKNINTKVLFFRLGMLLSFFTTLILGTTTSNYLWIISRVLAGFGSAMALVVGSAIVMNKLNMENKTKAMGIHFSGIGFSILITDLIVRFVFYLNGSWKTAWIVLSFFALISSLYSMNILSYDREKKQNSQTYKFNKSLFSPFVILLIIAYFCEGVGMVVQGTFLPDIINSLEGLQGFGSFTWTLVGIAGIPSCIFWMVLANRFGSVNVIVVAMFLQVVGILISALTNNVYLNLLSGILFGGTFIGLVALFLNLGGKIAGGNPVFLMGSLTSAYGIGQVTAPLYSVLLIDHFKSYDYALFVTALIVLGGISLLVLGKFFHLKEE